MQTQLRDKKDVALVWKHTHPDYKSKSGGVKTIIYPSPYGGIGPIESMPEKAYQQALAFAKKKESWEVRSKLLRPIMQKHGLLAHFDSTSQWRDSIEDIKTFAGFSTVPVDIDALVADIISAGISF